MGLAPLSILSLFHTQLSEPHGAVGPELSKLLLADLSPHRRGLPTCCSKHQEKRFMLFHKGARSVQLRTATAASIGCTTMKTTPTARNVGQLC